MAQDDVVSGSSTWTLRSSTKPDWVTISPTSGSNGATITISASINSSESSRSARIYFDNACGQSDYIDVNQDGKPHAANYVFQFNTGRTSETMTADWDGSSTTFGVTSTKDGAAIEWTVESIPSWVTATKSGNNLSVSVQANNSSVSRTGTVTLKQNESGKTITLTITQGTEPVTTCYLSITRYY